MFFRRADPASAAPAPAAPSAQARPVLGQADAVRMTRVIAAVAQGHGYHPQQCCFFFACAGALLMRHHHHLPAVALAGAAAYCLLGPGEGTLCYGRLTPTALLPTHERYHCWVECDGQVLDLMAPLFADVMASLEAPAAVERRAFCKSAQLRACNVFDLAQPGDFYLAVDFAMTQRMLQSLETRDIAAFMDDCLRWYRPSAQVTERDFPWQYRLSGGFDCVANETLEVVGLW